jgi:hypothetical protein
LKFDTLNIAISYGICPIASGIFIIDKFGYKFTTSKSKKDGEAILTEEAGRVSKRFLGKESRALERTDYILFWNYNSSDGRS